MQELARRIIMLRNELGLSSEAVARKISTSHKTVITWEKNRGDPSLENLLALADLFGVSPDYLLGRTEDRLPASGGSSGPSGPDSAREDSGASHADRADGEARAARPRSREPRRPS